METREGWERIKELFGAALDQVPADRDAFLRDACGSDSSLLAEVESLLKAHETPSGVLQSPWPAPEAEHAPRSIGPYQLLEKIGEGGMGQVWLAEQTAPLQRKVALKLIRWGIYDDALLHRFQAERQSLAVMDHPSIAKVFDAGTTPEGQPYFVMEYVPGIPITDYCDQKKLKIRERLEPFIKVCEGVQHAHQKAIIHRDLKPANILVQEIDGKPVPRIIDFGLAKALDTGTSNETLYTQFAGTPGYMSPEQSDPGQHDVDTRADVYSLGVVLYVLLTGLPPFDAGEWKKKPPYEILRLLREHEPPRPSTRVATDRNTSSIAAEARGTEPKQLVNILRGDLDWITMKAVEKDRTRRYGTPSDLAADLSRYLNHQPVTARPDRFSYRLRKYVRRNRTAVAVSAVLVALLIAFGIAQNLQLRKTTRERDRADRIADFMTGIFKVSDPNEGLGTTTAARLLDNASKDINSGLSKDPELQASMQHVIGRAYMYQGLYPRAQSMFEQSIKASTSIGQQESRDSMNTAHDLAWALYQQDHVPEAETLERKLLETQRRVLGANDGDTLATESELAFTICDEHNCTEGIRLNREVLEKQKRSLGPEAHYTLVTMDNLAIMLAANGQLAEAEKLEQQSLDIHMRVFGPENLSTISAMINLAELQRDMGKNEEAGKLMNRTLEIEQHVLGPNQPETAVTTYDLATILVRSGQVDQALILLRQAIDHGLPPRMAADMEKDSIFNPLHTDSRFTALVEYVKERADAQNQKH